MTVLIVARGKPLIDQAVSLINAVGVPAGGTTDERLAVAKLETGDVSTLIIGGGVPSEARHRLEASASRHGVHVIEGDARGGKDLDSYVREEILTALRRA